MKLLLLVLLIILKLPELKNKKFTVKEKLEIIKDRGEAPLRANRLINFRGLLAATGGEINSNYFQYSTPKNKNKGLNFEMKYKFTKIQANHFKKVGVEMWIYSSKKDCEQGNIVYQEVDGGHYEEFINYKSAFIYYILKGRGKFIIEGKEYLVRGSDVIIIPPGKRFYYLGKMKQVLVVIPAWEESSEKIIRKISPSEKTAK